MNLNTSWVTAVWPIALTLAAGMAAIVRYVYDMRRAVEKLTDAVADVPELRRDLHAVQIEQRDQSARLAALEKGLRAMGEERDAELREWRTWREQMTKSQAAVERTVQLIREAIERMGR